MLITTPSNILDMIMKLRPNILLGTLDIQYCILYCQTICLIENAYISVMLGPVLFCRTKSEDLSWRALSSGKWFYPEDKRTLVWRGLI